MADYQLTIMCVRVKITAFYCRSVWPTHKCGMFRIFCCCFSFFCPRALPNLRQSVDVDTIHNLIFSLAVINNKWKREWNEWIEWESTEAPAPNTKWIMFYSNFQIFILSFYVSQSVRRAYADVSYLHCIRRHCAKKLTLTNWIPQTNAMKFKPFERYCSVNSVE